MIDWSGYKWFSGQAWGNIHPKKTIQWYVRNKQWLKNTQTGEYRRFYKKYYSQLGLKEF